ncbi:MAG: GNAT family N-acetyltransferase [Ruminococcus sp.]|nr:GNAT family N-acetyltransferase [Ruminococcus sp.]
MLSIIPMKKIHSNAVKEMMREFYSSPAVFTDGSEEIFGNNINACLGENTNLEGYVFVDGEDVSGYAMAAKSFSTEFGKPCIWIEDIYLKAEYHGNGAGKPLS